MLLTCVSLTYRNVFSYFCDRMRPTVFILVAILAASAVAAPQQQQQRQQQSEEEQEDITTTTTVASVRRPPAEQRKPIEADTSSEEELKPVAIHRPATHDTASAKPEVNSDSDPATDVRREEHKKIVPFQFHRVCRELDLKRQNCSCVWESTFQVWPLPMTFLFVLKWPIPGLFFLCFRLFNRVDSKQCSM